MTAVDVEKAGYAVLSLLSLVSLIRIFRAFIEHFANADAMFRCAEFC